MSMLATASPSPHPSSFGMPRPWETNRCPDYSLRPRTENDKVALPSIRQVHYIDSASKPLCIPRITASDPAAIYRANLGRTTIARSVSSIYTLTQF
ncbi:hypothetical protein LB503_006500 [Fusarium chuoi]|nr:hypothetical protein LB503_006500 [Fusarium chuoi]